ncbi:glycogen synthase [Aquimarina pacifica]|uniref:glycogen synthase n=1 Tax=Aquimarina pacifica TaxID=1296415 RepID=UPI000470428E|nr:glycogen/starch synthase [Aquimarina pacifica]
MNILHISFECYPIAKVGGLADVVSALPKYQNTHTTDTSVIIPFYKNEFTKGAIYESVHKSTVFMRDTDYSYSVEKVNSPDLGFTTYLVYVEGLLDRPNVYNYEDDAERSIIFQLVVLDWLNTKAGIPDIIHCHDHHTGLIPFLMAHGDPYTQLRDIPTVLTIHNAQYQGKLSYDKLGCLPSFDKNKIGLLDWDQLINPLASAIKCASRVTAVSKSYMLELQERANGLEGLLRQEKDKCVGILNGIDLDTWNTETDPMVIQNYKISNVVSGRKENKKWLCDNFGFDINKPLFGFIGRLVGEKGADLLPEIVQEAYDVNHIDASLLILGSGNKDTEERLTLLKEKYSGLYNTFIGYDEKLSHIVYAGADFLLMPSRVEPCGLNQMYALRYGSIPIVRRTGGLRDTVIDIGDNGFGICHDQASVWDVCYSMKRAVSLYEDQGKYREIQKQIMEIDHSWERSAKEYKRIYELLIPN